MFDPGELAALIGCVNLRIDDLEVELDNTGSDSSRAEIIEDLETFKQLKEKIRSEMNHAMFNPSKSRRKK